MSKKKKRRKNHRLQWKAPKNRKQYFSASSDDRFKKAHPIGYYFLVMLALVALLLPSTLFSIAFGKAYGWENAWIMLGWIGGFHGYEDSNLLVSHLLFLANSSVFSLLGVSQAASNTKQLTQKFLSERYFAVFVSLFFIQIRQKTKEC